jgi:putative hydrolase of the HAD superfamily
VEEMIKVILFDIDDTLCARSKAVPGCMRLCTAELKRQSGVSLSAENFEKLFKKYADDYLPHATIMRNLLEDVNVDDVGLADSLMQTYRDCMQKGIELFPGAIDVLTLLSRRYALGAVSNASADSQRHKIADLKIDRFFLHVVISSEIGITKPAPEIFWHAVKLFECEPSSAVYVGNDAEKDINGAKNAGLSAIFVDIDGAGAGVPDNADATITSLWELPKVIESL